MAQFSSAYVKIKTTPLQPMNLAVGTVFKCTGVVARYLIDNARADLCNSAGTLIEPPWSPKLQGIIADGTTVTLAYDMTMTATDATGLVVNVDGTPASIFSAAASGDNIVITMSATVGTGTVVSVDYDATTGNIANSNAVAAPNFNDIVATNLTA